MGRRPRKNAAGTVDHCPNGSDSLQQRSVCQQYVVPGRQDRTEPREATVPEGMTE